MKTNVNRREFSQSIAALGAGAWVLGGVSLKPSLSAIEEIRFASIGVGGKGSSDSLDASNHGKMVAYCDIDQANLDKKKENFGAAVQFTDYRKMLEQMGDSIDAVTVSTPDHTHAVAALMAMRMGKHCFCQKPLTHSIEESRLMSKVAKETGVVTQMGNQGTALSNLRESAALVRNGIVGRVAEVHVWSNRPVWPQALGLKVRTQPSDNPNAIREWNQRAGQVDWQQWLGPAEHRAYSPEIHPFKWRGFWEFGTGALGDMACHTLNMAYMALDLKFPTSIESEHAEHDGVCYPASSKIKFEFPELNGRPPVTVYWYDGGNTPAADIMADLPKRPGSEGKPDRHYASGAVVIGEKGKYYSPGDNGSESRHTGLVVDGEFTRQRTITRPSKNADPAESHESPFSQYKNLEYVKSPGHFTEFAEAIKGNGKTVSEFVEYAGPLSETVLAGNLAIAAGKKVIWDAQNMVAQDASESIQKMIRHEYHNGYSILQTDAKP